MKPHDCKSRGAGGIFYYSLLTLFMVISCKSENVIDYQKENERLIKIIDSLTYVNENEQFSVFVFDPYFGSKINNRNSLKLSIGLTYYRPNLDNEIQFFLTQSEDSLSEYFSNPSSIKSVTNITQFTDLSDQMINIRIHDLKKGKYYFGGYITLNSFQTITLPFRYDFVVE